MRLHCNTSAGKSSARVLFLGKRQRRCYGEMSTFCAAPRGSLPSLTVRCVDDEVLRLRRESVAVVVAPK